MVDQGGSEGLALAGVIGRDDGRLPDGSRAAEHAVEPGGTHHVDDRSHAAAGLAQPPGDRLVVFDLARSVRGVPELVLEPLDVHGVATAIRQYPRQEEAREAL